MSVRALHTLIATAILSAPLGCASYARVEHGGVSVHTFTLSDTNAHLVKKGAATILIDAGYEKNAEDLDEMIRKKGFDPSALKAIVLTHGHADHAGGARWFQKHYMTPVIAGAADRKMLGEGANEKLCPTGFLGLVRQTEDQAATFTPLLADLWVDKDTPLAPMTGIEGTVMPLPGHTGGSLVVTIGEHVFAGDLFRGSLVGSGAGTHLYMCDLAANRRAVDALLHTLAPRGKTFFVGHFGPVARASVASHFDMKP